MELYYEMLNNILQSLDIDVSYKNSNRKNIELRHLTLSDIVEYAFTIYEMKAILLLLHNRIANSLILRDAMIHECYNYDQKKDPLSNEVFEDCIYLYSLKAAEKKMILSNIKLLVKILNAN